MDFRSLRLLLYPHEQRLHVSGNRRYQLRRLHLQSHPLIAYAIRDNMAIGVKFIYSRSLLRIDSGSIKLGSDIDLGVDFYNALQHNYSGAFIWRQYIPLGQNKRFALFNETSLTLGGGQSRFAADSRSGALTKPISPPRSAYRPAW